MFTMFTSTKNEKIMKGQKKYYLLPYEKTTDIYTNAPIHMREANKEISKKKARVLRKTKCDMTPFG